MIEEAPLSARDARRKRRSRKGDASEEEEEEGDSDDEREVERMRGTDRYRWDRSAVSLVMRNRRRGSELTVASSRWLTESD